MPRPACDRGVAAPTACPSTTSASVRWCAVLVRRALAVLLVAVLVGIGPLTSPAGAADDPVTRAADSIVATFQPGTAKPYGDVGAAADSLLALAATADDRYASGINGILAFLKKQAKTYVKPKAAGTSGAAKLALVAAATGSSATSFGGVNLIAIIKAGVGRKGSFGGWPGPFASGTAMVALARNGEKVPKKMVTYLLSYAEPRTDGKGGGFACTTYPFEARTGCPAADPDSTAMAVLGLQAAGSAKAKAAAASALEWLRETQRPDGSWTNYAPVNSTSLAGPLFPAESEQFARAVGYLLTQQLPEGALTTGADPGANLLATQQGVLGLTGTTYATLGEATPVPLPAPAATTAPTVAPASDSGAAVAWSLGILALIAAGVVTYFVAGRRPS